MAMYEGALLILWMPSFLAYNFDIWTKIGHILFHPLNWLFRGNVRALPIFANITSMEVFEKTKTFLQANKGGLGGMFGKIKTGYTFLTARCGGENTCRYTLLFGSINPIININAKKDRYKGLYTFIFYF